MGTAQLEIFLPYLQPLQGQYLGVWSKLACQSPTMHSTMRCFEAILRPSWAIVGSTLRPLSSSGPILGRMVGCMVGACVSKPNQPCAVLGHLEAILGHCRPDSTTYVWAHGWVHGLKWFGNLHSAYTFVWDLRHMRGQLA